MLNIGIENIQPKVSTEMEVSIEELIDFATAVGIYSDEINQDFKILDQHILAVENLISVLDNLKKHGVTPALEALVGNQIELSEASLENFITEGIQKIIDFIRGIIKRIKEFFTGSADKQLDKEMKEIRDRTDSQEEETKKQIDDMLNKSLKVHGVLSILTIDGYSIKSFADNFLDAYRKWRSAAVRHGDRGKELIDSHLETIRSATEAFRNCFDRVDYVFRTRNEINLFLQRANTIKIELAVKIKLFEIEIESLSKLISDQNKPMVVRNTEVLSLFKTFVALLEQGMRGVQSSITILNNATRLPGYKRLNAE